MDNFVASVWATTEIAMCLVFDFQRNSKKWTRYFGNYFIFLLEIAVWNSFSSNSTHTWTIYAYSTDSYPSCTTENSSSCETLPGFIYESRLYTQNRKNFDWWGTMCSTSFGPCLNYMITRRRGSHWLVVYAGYSGAVPDGIRWLARRVCRNRYFFEIVAGDTRWRNTFDLYDFRNPQNLEASIPFS